MREVVKYIFVKLNTGLNTNHSYRLLLLFARLYRSECEQKAKRDRESAQKMSINFSKLLAQEIEKKKKMKTPPSSKTTRTNENDNDEEKMRKKADELMSDEVFFAQFFTRKPIEDWDTY